MTWQAHSADLSKGREKVAVPTLGLEPEHWSALDDVLREYQSVNVPHSSVLEGSRLVALQEDEKAELFGCDCHEEASCGEGDKSCDCVGECGNFYAPRASIDGQLHRVLLLDVLPPLHPLRECSTLCRCQAEGTCQNAVVSSGLHLPLLVRPAADKGLGLFATTSIPRGSFVCEYAGELVSDSEARSRWSQYAEMGLGNYILCLKESSRAEEEVRESIDGATPSSSPRALLRTNIDPTRIGNLARFINHSCEPNLVILPVRCDAPWKLSSEDRTGRLMAAPPRAALFAISDISPGAELSFDYAQPALGGDARFPGGSGSERQAVVEEGRTPCKCGAAKCRRWLYFDPDL